MRAGNFDVSLTTDSYCVREIGEECSDSGIVSKFGEFHLVGRDKLCSCGAPGCLHVKAVRYYIKRGGKKVGEQQPSCPLCGCRVDDRMVCLPEPDHEWSYRVERFKLAVLRGRKAMKKAIVSVQRAQPDGTIKLQQMTLLEYWELKE